MPVTSPPLTLSASLTATITAPIKPAVGQNWEVRLDNASWFAVTINSLGGGHHLPPNSSMVLSGSGGPASVDVTVIAQAASVITGATPVLAATWAVLPDRVSQVGGWGGGSPFGYLTRDEFYWPCIDGEGLPPTFQGSDAYSTILSRPTVHDVSGGAVVWPNVPRVSPLDPSASTLTISYFVAVGSTQGLHRFIYGAAPFVDVEVTPPGAPTWQLRVRDAASTNQLVDTGVVATLALAGFDQMTLVLDATGVSLTVLKAGTTTPVTVKSTKLWLPGDPNISLQPELDGGQFHDQHLTQLGFSYS